MSEVTIAGTVNSALTDDFAPLSGATISIYDHNLFVGSTESADDGSFSIQVELQPNANNVTTFTIIYQAKHFKETYDIFSTQNAAFNVGKRNLATWS